MPVPTHKLAYAAGTLSFIPANQFVGLCGLDHVIGLIIMGAGGALLDFGVINLGLFSGPVDHAGSAG